jgi:hypothetical protein
VLCKKIELRCFAFGYINNMTSPLEDAQWAAEYAELREQALIDEYYMDKRNKYDGEHGHDGCFPNPLGATVWIWRKGTNGFLCYFDSYEEASDFGYAFLKRHASAAIGDSFGKQGGIIGQSDTLLVGIYKSKSVNNCIWSHMSNAIIVPAGLALILGASNNPKQILLDSTKDPRISTYILECEPWR